MRTKTVRVSFACFLTDSYIYGIVYTYCNRFAFWKGNRNHESIPFT